MYMFISVWISIYLSIDTQTHVDINMIEIHTHAYTKHSQ